MTAEERINKLEKNYNILSKDFNEMKDNVNIKNDNLSKIEVYGPKLDDLLKSFNNLSNSKNLNLKQNKSHNKNKYYLDNPDNSFLEDVYNEEDLIKESEEEEENIQIYYLILI